MEDEVIDKIQDLIMEAADDEKEYNSPHIEAYKGMLHFFMIDFEDEDITDYFVNNMAARF